MKQHSLLVSLGLVVLLCLGLGFTQERASAGRTVSTGSGTTSATDLTEAVVKQIVTKRENNLTKYSTGPKSITVTFESIQFGRTRAANKQDEFNGIPLGETVHPVRVKYTSVRHYSNTDEEKNIHYDYDFYKDSFGEWAALGVGPVR